jgi:hypothetical protein
MAFHEVGGAFRVVDHFATVTRATARSGQHSLGLRIVGLLHSPSLTLQFRLVMNLRACEGLPVQARLGVGSTNGPALMTFASPTKTLSSLRRPVSLLSFRFPAFRPSTGGLRGSRTPLLGLSKFAPPSASAPGVHSHRLRCSEELLSGSSPRGFTFQRGAGFGPGLPPPGLVPPLSFLPTAAVYSTWHLSGLLRPETDHGVRQVSGFRGRVSNPAWSFVSSH